MTQGHSDTTGAPRFFTLFLTVASIWYIAFFLVVALLRANFPLQLEWLEGGVLDAVARVVAHQPIYVAPTHLFVPYIYTPLYYYVGALACRMGGIGFTPLRLLSTVCTAGCFALLFAQTRALTASRQAGLIAAGCFAGLYAAAAGYYDLARVDMLYLLLAVAAIYAVWRQQPLLAGVLFACAYQSKQGAAIIAICVLAGTWRRPRQCIAGLLSFFVAAGGSTLWLQSRLRRLVQLLHPVAPLSSSAGARGRSSFSLRAISAATYYPLWFSSLGPHAAIYGNSGLRRAATF